MNYMKEIEELAFAQMKRQTNTYDVRKVAAICASV